jgi:CheY-like chemotaxis protein
MVLAGVIGELLDGQATTGCESHLLGVFLSAPPAPAEELSPSPSISPVARIPAAALVRQTPVSLQAEEARPIDAGFQSKAHVDFLQKAAETGAVLRAQVEALRAATSEHERAARLQDLRRRFEFLTATAETAGCERIARMSNALQALLLGMMDKATRITPSALDSIHAAVDFLVNLFEERRNAPEPPLAPAQVIVVDDDQFSNRLVVSSLRAVQIRAQSANDPVAALRLLAAKYYDLVLLDVEMPGMDGISFCRRLRTLPGYQNTPVIFVTLHSDPETRARTAESGGNDLIAKPIAPLELAVKVVMHWLKRNER